MAEMRLIVAGAGRRMGRTLVKAISDIKGFALAGVLEDTRSPLIGCDAGTLAGTPENGVKLTGDAAALIDKADGIVDFTALTNCPPKRFTPSRRRRGRGAGAVALAPRGSETGRCLSVAPYVPRGQGPTDGGPPREGLEVGPTNMLRVLPGDAAHHVSLKHFFLEHRARPPQGIDLS